MSAYAAEGARCLVTMGLEVDEDNDDASWLEYTARMARGGRLSIAEYDTAVRRINAILDGGVEWWSGERAARQCEIDQDHEVSP